MIREPYIFLSQNYAKFSVDSQYNAVSLTNLEISTFPFEMNIFLTDKFGQDVNRLIDTLLLEDTNLEYANIEYISAGKTHRLFRINSNHDNTILVKAVEPIVVNAIKITIPKTGNPEVVSIGKLGFYKYLCDLCAETDSSFKVDANSGSYRTLSGDIVYYGDYGKWQSKIKISNLPKGQFDTLTKEIRETNELTIIPYKDFDFTAVYECYLEPKVEYEVNRKTELYALELEAQEL